MSRVSALLPAPQGVSDVVREEPELLHHWFTRAARRWPNQPAVDVPPGAGRPSRRIVTYAELDRLSDALAAILQTSISSECVVAVLLPRMSERLYLAQLAILKAGAAHACIDPSFPDDQLARIFEDVAPVALVTDAAGAVRLRTAGLSVNRIINLDAWRPPTVPTPLLPPTWLTPESLAYVIYTSGTTGRPKGVMIEHAGIVNLVRADADEFNMGPGDRVAQNSSSSYDSSVEEVWFALGVGATLVVMDDEAVRLGPDLVAWLRDERITMICPSPTLLRSAGHCDPARELPDLRMLYAGGEALTPDVAERWAPGRVLINSYGPTECSVTCTWDRVVVGEPITIGRPLPGFRAWVLDQNLNEVADGEPGELCMGGVGLARGYHNRPELTAQKFPVHPEFGRIYRTGDLVHRGPDGRFHYHGRIDAQVKVRGYRIELEAIEAKLEECPGVREAVATVQGAEAHARLVAFIVPEDAASPPEFDALKAHVRKTLPSYMVPSQFGLIDRLPTTVSGKLDRKKLPVLAGQTQVEDDNHVAPRNPGELLLADAFRKTLGSPLPVSVHDDFFNHLGGDSLRAAMLISRLREDPATSALTVRDVYETRTVAELARRLSPPGTAESPQTGREESRPPDWAVAATVVQSLCLGAALVVGALFTYASAFHLMPFLWETFGTLLLVLLTPVIMGVVSIAYTLVALGFAVALKKVLIGRYTPTRAPVWSGFYVRNWLVQQAVRLVPWSLLAGTVFQNAALRLLGARIGRRVHIHRGVNLVQGGWDLLDIGDDVTLSQESWVRLVELHAGEVIVSPVSIGSGSTLEVRAGVGGDTRMEENSYLTALSYLPRGGCITAGQKWDGVPARPAGPAPAAPTPPRAGRTLSPLQHGVALVLARAALSFLVLLPYELIGLAVVLACGSGYEFEPSAILLGVALVMLSTPVTLLAEAFAVRALGRVQPGVISRWSTAYIRVWLKTDLVDAAGAMLNGTLFWPKWLRLAGMKIGRGCEISTIIDVVPELVEIGEYSFFADGIYLAGPRLHRGAVTMRPVRLGKNTFLGNHAVIAEGQHLPPDVLFGIATVADGISVTAGSSWFGIPPFELPRREVVEMDRSLTHEPTAIRYWNRVLWETARIGLPVVPFLLLLAWFESLTALKSELSSWAFLLLAVPGVTLAGMLASVLLVVAVKWALLGKVKPGTHALWSCWCCRWDFVYICWQMYGRGLLVALEGTLLLPIFLRAMGCKIGRRVVLGPGYSQVVDPDMLHFEDGATVNAMFQAHTFEDRVLKIDHVFIRKEATVGSAAIMLYGAEVGAQAEVSPHSVVMKRERLLPGLRYEGHPTRPASATASS